MQKKLSFMAEVSVLAVGFYAMADMFVVSPLLGDIRLAFPQADTTWTEMCCALSQITVMISSLLCVPLCKVFSKKNLLLAGSLLVAVCGGFGAIFVNLAYMLVMRGLEGIGAGFCIALIPAVIAEMCENDEMQKLIGWQAAAGAAFGAVCGALTGQISVAFGWQRSYFLYFFSLLIFVLELIWLPNTPVEKRTADEAAKRINGSVRVWCLVVFVYAVLTDCIFIKEAELFLESGIGDASVAGFSQSMLTVGSFIGGVFLLRTHKWLKEMLEPVCWSIFALGAAIITFSANAAVIYAGSFVFGLGYGTFFPWVYAKTVEIAAPGTQTESISIVNIAYYLGMFFGVFIYQGLGAVFNNRSASFSFVCMLTICIAAAAISIACEMSKKKRATFRKTN